MTSGIFWLMGLIIGFLMGGWLVNKLLGPRYKIKTESNVEKKEEVTKADNISINNSKEIMLPNLSRDVSESEILIYTY